MTRDEAITRLKNMAWLYGSTEREQNIEAIDMAIEALKADVARWSSWNKTFEQSGIADLISRADAIKAVEQEYKIDRGYMVDDYTYGFNQAIQYVSDIILQDLPSADTDMSDYCDRLWKIAYERGKADRPTGEWIDKGDYAECSNCGAYSGTQFDGVEPVPRKTKFCPNCGAKMGGDSDG